MSSNPFLPPEILDYIVDLLHDNPEVLRECCLTSTSWIPRTRKHLFARIKFHTPNILQSWKDTFPDPFDSPAHHTRALAYSQSVVDATAADWIAGFSHVVRLEVTCRATPDTLTAVSFVPFHGFPPAIKYLRVVFSTLPTPEIFNLILSFPLLEDLSMATYFGEATGDDGFGGLQTAIRPQTQPTFTGSLDLFLGEGIGPVTSWLLSLPGGIHFQKLSLAWFREADAPLITALVRECSDTLESLHITLLTFGTSIQHPCPLQ